MTDLTINIIRFARKWPFFYLFRNWVARRRGPTDLAAWEKAGKPSPPPHIVKQRVLQEYASRYGLRILVETGTYYGDMIEALRPAFDRIYSIELSAKLYQQARKRFHGVGHVELINGDSGHELEGVLRKVTQPVLFWLDGHYSAGVTARGVKDTPIFEELHLILESKEKKHVIIIDDARCFGKDPAYPTIEDLIRFIRIKKSDVDVAVQDDMIRITPMNS